MTKFTTALSADSVKRSSSMEKNGCDQCNTGCVMCCPVPEKPTESHWPGVHKIITNVCKAPHPDTGKTWIVQECLVFDCECEKWKADCEGICEMPSKLMAGDALPSFDGTKEVWVHGSQTPIPVSGGQTLPLGMIGFFLCIDGEICYVGDAPAPIIPEEIWEGSAPPPADSEYKEWNHDSISKTKNPQGLWVQESPYGGV